MGSTILDAVRFVAAAPTGPANATAQTVGTPGQAQYYYWVVTHYPIGAVASGPFFVRNAPDLLSLQNYVAVAWDPQQGATGYDLLRTTTPLFPQVAGNYAVWIDVINNYLTDDGTTLQFYNPQALAWGAPVATQIHFNNRDYNLPTLEIPGQLRVGTLMFSDGTQQETAGQSQTPWLSNINANGFSLQNAASVGIGTAAPLTALDANGTIRTTGATSGVNAGSCVEMYFASGTGYIDAYNYASGGAVLPLQISGQPLTLRGANTTAVQTVFITGTGVGIGTTAPAYPLHIEAPAPSTQVTIQNNTGTNGTGLIIGDASKSYFLGNNLLGAVPGEFQICDASIGAVRIAITSAGNVGIGTTASSYLLQLNADSAAKPATSTWTIASDIRTKQNIETLDEDSTAILRRIEWQRFEYNGLGCTQRGARTVGLTAQDLQAILPEAVRAVPGRLRQEDPQEFDLLAIDYHYLFVRACRAVQELDQRLAKLENKKHK